MHLPINVKSPNNISKWQVGFNSAFKGLKYFVFIWNPVALMMVQYHLLAINDFKGEITIKTLGFLVRRDWKQVNSFEEQAFILLCKKQLIVETCTFWCLVIFS
jgi:hypothetical protein